MGLFVRLFIVGFLQLYYIFLRFKRVETFIGGGGCNFLLFFFFLGGGGGWGGTNPYFYRNLYNL